MTQEQFQAEVLRRFEWIDRRLDTVGRNLDLVEHGLRTVESRLSTVEGRLDGVGDCLEDLQQQVTHLATVFVRAGIDVGEDVPTEE